MKTITELKKTVLLSKKESKELSQAYAAILKQVEAQTVGVKNAETDELKLIIKACNKELKEQEQSKTSGAPYSEQTIELCKLFLNDLKPKTLSEQETIDAINKIKESNPEANKGVIMGALKKEYSDLIDMKLANSLI